MSTFTWSFSNVKSDTKPLIILLGWMECQAKHLKVYIQLYNEFGCDTMGVRPPTLHMWFPRRAVAFAREILDAAEEHLAQTEVQRPVLIVVFSGATKACYDRMLQVLRTTDGNQYMRLRTGFAGQCFDSSPVDFLSQNGIKFLAPKRGGGGDGGDTGPVRRGVLRITAALLDLLFEPTFFRPQRRVMWRELGTPSALPRSAPTLFLYSEDDHLADAHNIRCLNTKLNDQGWETMQKCWSISEHVSHLRLHPDEYREAVNLWLRKAMHSWELRHMSSQQYAMHQDANPLNIFSKL